MNHKDFIEKVRKVASKDTSFDPDNWSKDNPLWGHCAIVSLLAQDYFGGDLVRGSLEDVPEFLYLKSHYWNKLGSGVEIDFTQEQFGKQIDFSDAEIKSREHVLSSKSAQERYQTLKRRFEGSYSNS